MSAKGGAGGAGAFPVTFEPYMMIFKQSLNYTGQKLGSYAEPYHDEFRLIGTAYGAFPSTLLMAMHFLNICTSIDRRHYKPYFVVSYWVSFFACAGGGTLANFFMQEPPAIFIDDSVLPIFTLCWFLVNYAPGEIGAKLLSYHPVRVVCRIASSISRARAISDKANLAIEKLGPGAISGPLVIATVAGLGGKLLSDFASRLFTSKKDTGPIMRELVFPSWASRSAALFSFVYLSTTHWMPILPKDVGSVLIATIMITQGLASDLTGYPLDFTAPIATLFHSLSGIPAPGNPQADPSGGRQTDKEQAKTAGKRQHEEEGTPLATVQKKEEKRKA